MKKVPEFGHLPEYGRILELRLGLTHPDEEVVGRLWVVKGFWF
jgi:hypothetical protein